MGIVANSDGHKGRPGAEPPGASLFGALGGLTCFLMTELSRDALFDALQERRHYATTGNRIHLAVQMDFAAPVKRWIDDPRVEGARSGMVSTATMGDIIETDDEKITFNARIAGSSPILAIELRNGNTLLDTIRPCRSKGRLG